MYYAPHHSLGMRLFTKAASVFRTNGWALNRIDPDGLRYVTTITVRGHWLISAVCLVELVYRPHYEIARYASYALLLLILIGFNGYIHYRDWSNRPVTWHWLLGLYTTDVLLVSAGVVISSGFDHAFFHLFYYPALAALAVMFNSFRLNMVWVTLSSVVYVAICLTVGDGIALDARDEKTLLARIVVMYAVVATVNLASRFERARWEQSVERERVLERERAELAETLQNERIELSQAIHDTAAQTAYMIGLGVDNAKALAVDANPELTETLEEISRLSQSAMWELRHPISVGRIYEGRELNRALRSHAASFTNITSVPAVVTQTGVEPQLTLEVRSLLFSIAHNALTNAYRHADASRVSIELEFSNEGSRMSVSDDGSGLPDDYAERGNGFENMERAAERLGGHLVVEPRGPIGGATVTCLIPAKCE